MSGFLGYHFFSVTNLLGRHVEDSAATSLNDGVVLGIRVGYNLIPQLALEAELGIIPSSTHGTDRPAGAPAGMSMIDPFKTNVLNFALRGHIIWHILPGRVRPFILAGGGIMTSVPSNSSIFMQDTDPMFHVGAGVKVRIGENWGLRLDGRVYFPPDSQQHLVTEDYEATLGLWGAFGGPPKTPLVVDTDGDGIPDADDKCPKEAGIKANQGCPDVDTDKDGICDRLDKCIKEAGTLENLGCPEVDTDKDTVVDRLDKCPNEAGPKESDGCPAKDSAPVSPIPTK